MFPKELFHGCIFDINANVSVKKYKGQIKSFLTAHSVLKGNVNNLEVFFAKLWNEKNTCETITLVNFA